MLLNFIDKYTFLYKHKFGFWKGKSIVHTILDFHVSLIIAVESYVFLEFIRTFDTVDHTVILCKLVCYGIRAKALSWSQSHWKNLNKLQMLAINTQDIAQLIVRSH